MNRSSIDWSELSLQVMMTFAHFLWQACVVGFVLFVVQHVGESLRDSRIVRRRRGSRKGVSLGETDLRGANIRYAFACVAFFSLPMCVAATFAWVHQSCGPILLAASEPATSIMIPDVGTSQPIPTLENMDVPALPALEMPADTEIPSIESPEEFRSGASWHYRFQSFAPYLLVAYTIGVGLMLARFGLSIVSSSRLRRAFQPITDTDLMKLIAEQSSRLGLRRLPLVALCERVSVPVVVGLVKPMILLPPALLCGLDPHQLAAILGHEMAHIRRYDMIINLLQRIVEALLFFHPVTWWISRRISIERENCCDDLAAAGSGRIEYAAALLRMAEKCAALRGLKIAPQLESLAADGGDGSQLGYRIRRLLGEVDSPRVAVTRNALAAFTLAAVFSGMAVIAIAQTDQKPQATDRPEVRASETPEDEPNKMASSKSEAKTRIEGIVLDSEKRPIAGVPLLFLAFVGDEENAFKPIYLDADNEGRFSVEIPSRTFRAYFSSPNDQYESLEGFLVRDGQAVVPWDGIEAKPTDGKISVVATLPRTYQLRIDVINADSGQRVSDVAILYKEDEATWNGEEESDYETGAHWTPYQIIENGKQTFQASTSLIMGKAHVLIVAKGFELVQLKLNEELTRGQPVVKQVRVKSVAPVEFTLTTATGEPAAGATLEVLKSKELRAIRNCNGVAQLNQFLKIDVKSDARGIVRFPWPAFSNWTTYRFEHPAGYLDVRGKDLPKVAGESTGVARTIPLLAYTGVKGTYLPNIRENEFLEVYRLESNRNAIASEAQIVSVGQDGRFELTQLLHGWYSFVHRVRYTDPKGGKHALAIGGYGPIELSNEPMRELTLGNDGRSVVGRLKILNGAHLRPDTLTISVSSNTRHRYPVEPKGLDEASLKTWWDVYWDSEEGRQYHESSRRSYINAIGTDGRFHFPILPAGKYKLRAGRAVGDSELLMLPEHEFEIPMGTTTDTLDLGDIIVNVVNSASSQPMHVHAAEASDRIPARPSKVTVSREGSAKILDDRSVRLEGDVEWQEVSLQFEFDKPTNVEEIRLEVLPVDSPTGPQFGRGGDELILFDVKPSIEDQTGKSTSIDFASCTYLQNPSDETTANCIDQLSDTGWKVPTIPADATAHELVLRFEEPITLRAGQRLTLTIDSGGAKELAVLNRIRFAFRQEAHAEAMTPNKPNQPAAETADDVTTKQHNDSASSDRSETGKVVLHAIDADTGEPIRDVVFVKENALREDWATPVGRSDADGTVRIETKPLQGYFFSILPVPQGYKVTSLDEVPARVKVGDRVDYRFHLRKLGTNLEFVKNAPESNLPGNRFAAALQVTNQKSLRIVVNDMPGFREQSVIFSFARDKAPLAERIFANGELVRAAVNDELHYFEKAEGSLAGKISELYDIQVVISSSTLPRAPVTSWYLYCRTKDGIELKQDGFKVRFEGLDRWDLEIPAFLHPEF